MSDTSQGEGWWVASDGKWYPPEQHPDYAAPPSPATDPVANYAAETLAVPKDGTIPETVIGPGTNPGPTFTPAGAPLGTPPGAPVGTGPATETYNPSSPQTVAQLGSAPATAADPTYGLPETDTNPSSRRGLLLGIGALVLVAGLGFLAFRFFSGGSAAGGASSPENAVAQMIASINERDAVGFVDVFDPDEIDAWFGSFGPAFDEFRSLNESGEEENALTDIYTSISDSFDFTLTGRDGEDIVYEVEPIDDDGRISQVRIPSLELSFSTGEGASAIITTTGSSANAFDIGALDGAVLSAVDSRDGITVELDLPGEPPESEFTDGVSMEIVTIQKDGKWFISMGYTVMEQIRAQDDFTSFAQPDFGRAFELVDTQEGGAESPEAAVQEFFQSIETLDYDNMIRLTDPYGTPYLHDYQPLIDAEIDEEERRDAARDADIRIDELELEVSEWEGRTLVTFDSISGTADNGTQLFLDTESWCFTFEDEFDRERQCAEDGIAEGLFEADLDADARDFIPEETGFIVVERNGRWYLNPLGTLGYFADQVATAAASLQQDLSGNAVNEVTNFFLTQGPIARSGVPGITQARSGAAGVAVDLTGFPTIDNGVAIAVARVATDEPANFVGGIEQPLTGEDWVVVADSDVDDQELPAIAVSTDGTLDVELFEVPIVEVGVDGYSGQLGGQGRPQVFRFSQEARDLEPTVEGAWIVPFFTVFGTDVILPRTDTSGSLFGGEFAVVGGEPGAAFEIVVSGGSFEEPTQPVSNLGDPIADAFAAFIAPNGYSYASEQSGGFFDGCGPNDPDVTSYIFEDLDFRFFVVTPYPNEARARAAFDDLLEISNPCDGFIDLEVLNVEPLGGDEVRIEWQFVDDPASLTFEQYRLAGDTILVTSTGTATGSESQMALLRPFN